MSSYQEEKSQDESSVLVSHPADGDDLENEDNFVSEPSLDSYDMENAGKFVIFNNEEFNEELKLESLSGTKDNVVNGFQQLAGNMGFEVITHKDLKKDEILQKIKDYAANPRLTQSSEKEPSCIVFVFSTHGDTGDMLYAMDDKYSLKEVLAKFKKFNCKDLTSKPKVFIIEACRGNEISCGVGTETNKSDDIKDCDCFSLSVEQDFLVAHSTYSNHVAFIRDDVTSFTTSLLSVWEKSNKLSFMQVLINTNRHMVEKTLEDTEKQMPSITSQLTKEIYFTMPIEAESSPRAQQPTYDCQGGKVYIFSSKKYPEKKDVEIFEKQVSLVENLYKVEKMGMETKEILMNNLQKCASEEHTGALICLFLCDSAGTDGIKTDNDEKIQREILMRIFHNKKSLVGKPRIFLFKDSPRMRKQGHNNSQKILLLPLEADTLAVHSVPGMRNIQNGETSIFIEELCKNLKDGREYDFIQILTKVNKGMKEKEAKEIPCIVSQLTKRFFFYHQTKGFLVGPGIV